MLRVNGFLTSQIGYDLGDPKRALIRSYRRDYVPDGARFAVLPLAPENTPWNPRSAAMCTTGVKRGTRTGGKWISRPWNRPASM